MHGEKKKKSVGWSVRSATKRERSQLLYMSKQPQKKYSDLKPTPMAALKKTRTANSIGNISEILKLVPLTTEASVPMALAIPKLAASRFGVLEAASTKACCVAARSSTNSSPLFSICSSMASPNVASASSLATSVTKPSWPSAATGFLVPGAAPLLSQHPRHRVKLL